MLGYRSDEFAGFYIASTGFAVNHRVENAAEIAAIARARDELGLTQTLLISNPIRRDHELPDYDERLAGAARNYVPLHGRRRERHPDPAGQPGGSHRRDRVAGQPRNVPRQNVALAAEVAKNGQRAPDTPTEPKASRSGRSRATSSMVPRSQSRSMNRPGLCGS